MKYKLVIATNNKNKIQEIKTICRSSEQNISGQVCSYRDLITEEIDVIEDGKTFEANALKKCKEYTEACREKDNNIIVLADDSGLEVTALNGAPGIHSARYAGEGAGTAQLCQKLLQDMTNKEDRSAQFRTVIAISFPDGTYKTEEGIVKGQIITELKGTNGFGYDPVFQPEGYKKTFAEMTSEEKNKISHRYLATQKAIDSIYCLLSPQKILKKIG
jgi:XTP/dITP diphosphohydrolase